MSLRVRAEVQEMLRSELIGWGGFSEPHILPATASLVLKPDSLEVYAM